MLPKNIRRLRTGLILVGLVLGLWAAYRLFLRWTRIEPPAGAGIGVVRPRAQMRGQREYVGNSWSSHERGIWEFHLEGEPFALGYAHGRLGTRLLMDTEEYMFGEMRRYVPSTLALSAIRMGVLLRYRKLPEHITPLLRLEMAGMAEGQPDQHGDFLPIYHRIVFYHALHDIMQMLEHSPMLGCTALTAGRGATKDGHMLIGRNFDFEGPPIFDREKAVLLFKPAGKLAFASVAWAGMLGVVTGLNVAGVYVSVNALRSEDKSQSGVPVELLLRQVLESAHTLDEAIAIIKQQPVLVPDLYLIADGKSGESAVVERSPTRATVRRSTDSRDLLALANHALTPEFAGDKESERLRTEMTSGSRMTRMQELIDRQHGQLDALGVQAILRDKRGPGDQTLGLGNRSALDAIIATHSVVVDATALVLWVGVGPHALGRYVGFDLRRELLGEDRPQPADLPEDPVLHSEDFRAFTQAQRAMEVASAMDEEAQRGQAGRLERAIEEAELAVTLQPLSTEAQLLLADLLQKRALGKSLPAEQKDAARAQAKAAYSRFLTLSPPYKHDAERAAAVVHAP